MSNFLITIHRAENTDLTNRLKAIVDSLIELDTKIIWPLHPRTNKQLASFNLLNILEESKHIRLIEPVSYLEMLLLEKNAKGIITDSGGVQKEAYFAEVPCFTLRDETEWIETTEIGWNRLINPLEENLKIVVNNFTEPEYVEGLYGDGKATENIVQIIEEWFVNSYEK
jgi:UDP-N-acetylglucosamine 2-epimerase